MVKKVRAYKSMKQSYKSIKQEKKVVSLLIPDNISIEEELINITHVGASLYEKSKLKNSTIHKSKNGVHLIFSDNEDKQKIFIAF